MIDVRNEYRTSSAMVRFTTVGGEVVEVLTGASGTGRTSMPRPAPGRVGLERGVVPQRVAGGASRSVPGARQALTTRVIQPDAGAFGFLAQRPERRAHIQREFIDDHCAGQDAPLLVRLQRKPTQRVPRTPYDLAMDGL